MKLQVFSRPKKISLKLIREAAEFFAKYTFSPRINPKVLVLLKFVNDLYKKEQFKGVCEPLYISNNKLPRTFLIQIDASQSVRNILKTIAHELVHASDYSSGRLKDYVNKNQVRWRWDNSSDHWIYEYEGSCFDETDFEYYLAEWEIKAFGMEEGLYRLFSKYGRKK